MSTRNAEIYTKYASELVGFATVLVGPSAAEDVVAEAVTRAFKSPAWPAVEHPRAYLMRATLNQALQTHRTNLRRAGRERFFVRDADGDDASYVRIEVVEAMRRLTTRQRAVVYFTYWHELQCAEVAELMGMSPRTVQRELMTARRHLEVLLT
jgi:RNA polymerase sigma factor (sigma-70 family)